jgi:hypothetical protein
MSSSRRLVTSGSPLEPEVGFSRTVRAGPYVCVAGTAPKPINKPLTGHYRTAAGQNVRGGFSVPRADVAHLMLAVLGQPDTIGQVIGTAN